MVSAPVVVVAVGTDHHPFARLMGWIEAWPAGEIEWFVQHGTSICPPGVAGAALLGPDELNARMRAAQAVVCHGGPGLIMDVRTAGHRPVVVPRRPDLGEHVDGHQVQFVTWLSARTDIRVATDSEAFQRAVRAAIADGPTEPQATLRPDVAHRFGTLVDELLAGR